MPGEGADHMTLREKQLATDVEATTIARCDPGDVLVGLSNVVLRAQTAVMLDGVDLAIRRGRPTAIMGPNGAGKTSLLRLIMGLASPNAGEVTLAASDNGQPLRRAIVFQKPVMLRRTVAANIAFACAAANRPSGVADVERLLRLVGLSALAHRPARRLSGGEQQRLALARALAREPELLLLDEPTASLDPAQTKAVEEIIATVAASGVKVVIATHARGQAKRLAGEVVFLVRGRAVEQTPIAEFFAHARTEEARRFLAGDLVI